MKRTIRVLSDEAVLEIGYEGGITFRDRGNSLELLASLLRTHQLNALLVDFSRAHALPEDPDARGDFAVRLATVSFEGCRIALVNVPLQHGVPPDWVADIGGYHVRRFRSRDDAMQWLTAEATD